VGKRQGGVVGTWEPTERGRQTWAHRGAVQEERGLKKEEPKGRGGDAGKKKEVQDGQKQEERRAEWSFRRT